jgi:serine/threonine protein phosphatase PrpC
MVHTRIEEAFSMSPILIATQMDSILTQSFLDADSYYWKECASLDPTDASGSTAVVVIFMLNGALGWEMWCANVGDSEAVISNTMGLKVLTERHTCSKPSESARIQSLGGRVIFGRLFGQLEVSRAFGDFNFKKPKNSVNFCTAEPKVYGYVLDVEDKFVILASDGFWDVTSYIDAVEYVKKHFEEETNLNQISENLCSLALSKGSSDNVTVMIVKLEHQ